MRLSARTAPRVFPALSDAAADRLVMAAVALAIIAYAVVFSFLSLHRHSVYETDAFDLANMEQAVWNTTQGRPLDFTNYEGLTNRLGAHVEPILLLIAPLYALVSRPETLLVLQSVVIALGALPVSWLARSVLKSRVAAVVFPLVYLLFPALEAANLYDFHALTLTSAFIAYAFWFAYSRNNVGYWLSVVAALCCKEDVPLLIAMFGVWVAVGLRRWRLGLATIALALAWFVVAVMVVIPHWNPDSQSPYLDTRYGHLGSNLREIAGTLFLNPGYTIPYLLQPAKLGYVRDLLTPVAFLSVFAPVALLVLSPTLALTLLSGSKLQNTLELEHYPSPLVPVVVVSAIFGVGWLAGVLARRTGRGQTGSWATGLSVVVLVFTLAYHFGHGLTPLASAFAIKERTARHATADRLLPLIPPDASLTATGGLNAHLAARRTLYVYPKVADADWVFVDLAPSIAPIVNRDYFNQLSDLRRQGYGVVAAEDGYLILARDRPDQVDPSAAFRRSAPVVAPEASPVVARFGALKLNGYQVAYEGRATASLTLFLEAAGALPAGSQLYTVLLDAAGKPIPGSEAELIAPIWYPPDRWAAGERLAIETKRWGHKGDPGDTRIGLIVSRSGNPWDPAGRIAPTVEGGTALALPLDGGGILSLATLASDGVTIWDATPARLTDLPASARRSSVALGPARLEGVESAMVCRAPCALDMTLYWRTGSQLTGNPSVFLHVTGPDGRPLAQSDGPPDRGLRPAAGWLPGEVVADRHRIDVPALPPGDYRVLAGLYDPATGSRLAGPAGDVADLGTLRVDP